MLKKRIIPILLLKDERLVKTRKFNESTDVGDPVKSAYVYNSQQSDELIILNINRGDRNINPLKKNYTSNNRKLFHASFNRGWNKFVRRCQIFN